jgi:hypothetical protein
MITGHAGEGVDEHTYRDPEGLYEEICKLRFRVEPASEPRLATAE